jgi:ABC-type lipoprotein export system ATPase subunit
MEIMEQLNKEDGITIILVTHDPAVAECARRRVMLRDGGIVSDTAVEMNAVGAP